MRGIQRGLVRWKTTATSHRRLFSSAGDRRDQNVLLKSGGGHELGIRVED